MRRLRKILRQLKTACMYRMRVVLYGGELWWTRLSRLPLKLRASMVFFVILAGIAVVIPSANAVTTELVPVSSVSCTWAVNCAYTNVDDGSAGDTTDYIGTGTNGSGNEVIKLQMASPANVKTATSLQLYFYARAATINSTVDQLQMYLSVGGTDLAAVGTASTPLATTWGWYSYTYTGSWTQAQLNNLQFTITRIVEGGGSPSSRDDDVQIASMYVTATYTENSFIDQQAYRFYQNNTTPSTTTPTFANATGGTGTELGYASVPTSDGGYAVTGSTTSFGSSDQLFIAKYDSSGKQVFYKTWGGTGSEIGTAIIQTSDGGYAVGGYTSSSGAGAYDFLFITFDASGNFGYAKTWGGTGNDAAYALIQTSDGGFALTGQSDTTTFSHGGNDAVLVKLTSTGNLQFATAWGGAGQDFGQNVTQTSDGGYALVGQTASFGEVNGDLFFVKLTNTGTVDFARSWGGSSADNGYGVLQTSDGGYAFAGFDTDTTTGKLDAAIVKLTNTGALSRAIGWDGGEADSINMLTEASDGSIIVAGETNGSATVEFDGLLMKLDSSLNPVFVRDFGGTGFDQFRSVKQTSDGGYVAAGETASYGAGDKDSLLARYDSNGNITGCSAPLCTTVTGTLNDLSGSSIYTLQTLSSQTNDASTATFAAVPSQATVGQSPTVTVVMAPPAPTVGVPLANANTPAVVPGGNAPFRLRLNLGVSNGQAASGSFKLQFAPQDADGVCNNNESGYADITTASAVKYYDNTTIDDGATYAASPDDPTRTGVTAVGQTYDEANPFSINSVIGSGQDGLWDFALTTGATAPAGATYCIKAVNSGGGDLNGYTQIAAISTPPPRLGQADYRFFEDGTATVPTAQAWGGAGNDSGQSVAATTDGGYIVTGSTGSFAGSGGAYLAKYDSTGNLSWSRAWDSTVINSPYDVIQTADGGYAVAGYTTNAGAGSQDILLVKFDSGGNVSWSSTWGGTVDEDGYTVAQTTDGGYVVGGTTDSFAPGGSYDIVTVKFNASGTLQWARTWGGTGFDLPDGSVASSDGGVLITGSAAGLGSGGGGDAFLIKYDSSGTLSWSRAWGSTLPDTGYGVVQTSDGGYAMVGNTMGFGAGNSEFFLAKFNSTGTLQWSRTLGTSGVEYGRGITTTADGGLVVTGYSDTLGTGGGVNDIITAKYDSSGTLQWTRAWGGTGSDVGYGVVQSTGGSLGVVGTTANYGAGGNDMVFLRYKSDGSMLNCSAPMCQSVTPTVSSPTATSSSPVASTSSPSGTVTSPSITTVSITPTVTSIVAGDVLIANTPLASQDATASVDVATPFRLRSRIAVDNGNLQQSGQSFKLQYKAKTAQVCDPNATGYTDIAAAAAAGGSSSHYAASATESADGGNSWTTLSAATSAPDGSTASAYVGNQQTDYFTNTLQLKNYAMNIPAGTTITGITATISGNKDSNSTMTGFSAVNTATGKSLSLRTTMADFTTGNPVTYGSSTNAGSFTASDVNDSNFGVSLNFESVGSSTGDVYIDAVQITVYYSSGGSATDIAYYDNPALSDGASIAATAADPTNGVRTVVPESYRETGPFTNNAAAVPAGSDGLWDFALTSSAAADGKTYCLRVVKSDGSLLDSYLQIPEITVGTPPPAGPTLEQQLRGGQSVLGGVKTPFL